MQMKMNFRSWLFVYVGSLGVLSVLLGFAGLAAISSLSARFSSTLDRNVQREILAQLLLRDASKMVSSQSDLVLAAYAKDAMQLDASKEDFRRSAESFQKSVERLRPLISTEEGRSLISEIAVGASEWPSLFDDLARQCAAGNLVHANQLRSASIMPVSGKIDQAAQRFLALQDELLAAARKDEQDQEFRTRWIAIALVVLCLNVSGFIFFTIHRMTDRLRGAIEELAEGVSQVSGAASQVSSGSQALAQGSSKQADAIEETAASAEEINSMARKNSESSRAAADLVARSQQEFSQTNRALEEMVIAMSEITAGSDRISKIIKVIDEIAFQTNILALNAAVEAARAGEAGMGFAVVADEVRSLAQRSAQAAKDTASLIEESISKSNGGKVKVDEVAAAIHTITGEFSRIKGLVDQINLGSQEQAKGTDQIGRVITQMEQATQKNAASAEESASVSEKLSSQSNSLQDVVNRLAEMVGHNERVRFVSKPKSIRIEPSVKVSTVPPDLAGGNANRLDTVPAGVPLGRSDFPLDDDFKEF
jgi:methyl-accepting chemotaxis protein